MDACTLSLLSLIFFTISRAFSMAIPCCSVISCFTVDPAERIISPNSSPLSGTWRLTNFDWRISITALSLNSSELASRILLSFSFTSMLDLESFKSKRVWISLDACCTALSTSGISILETTSKVLSGIEFIPIPGGPLPGPTENRESATGGRGEPPRCDLRGATGLGPPPGHKRRGGGRRGRRRHGAAAGRFLTPLVGRGLRQLAHGCHQR